MSQITTKDGTEIYYKDWGSSRIGESLWQPQVETETGVAPAESTPLPAHAAGRAKITNVLPFLNSMGR